MSLAHVHLVLNHSPTIAFGIGLALYLAALYKTNLSLKRASRVLFFLTAVLAIPTYLSGNFAEVEICPKGECLPGVAVEVIRAHEDAALLAFVFMEITGLVAWFGLWQLRQHARVPRWNSAVLLLMALATFGLMGLAANKGGQIRHAEIHVAAAAPAAPGAPYYGIAKSMGELISGATGNSWLWPASETVHFVGLCLLFAVVLIVDLRILGIAKPLPFAGLYQLLPWAMLGFGLNLVTGMLFFMGKPAMYMTPVFYWKIALVVVGGINVLYFTLVDEVWAVGPGDEAPRTAKLAAASALAVWFGVLYCGHMLPFLGRSF